MKTGDIYYYHEQVWSDEEIPIIKPNPDEIFRDVYIKLVKRMHNPKANCADGWACFGADKPEELKDIRNETNVSYCTEYIRKNFRRIYDI